MPSTRHCARALAVASRTIDTQSKGTRLGITGNPREVNWCAQCNGSAVRSRRRLAAVARTCHPSETHLSHADDASAWTTAHSRRRSCGVDLAQAPPTMSHFTRLSIPLALFLFSAACASDTTSATTAPTAATTTETFSGTV